MLETYVFETDQTSDVRTRIQIQSFLDGIRKKGMDWIGWIQIRGVWIPIRDARIHTSLDRTINLW